MKRKKILIYPKFQITLLANSVFIFLLVTVFMSFELYLAYRSLIQMGTQVHLPENHVYFQFVQMQFKSIFSHFVIGIVLSTAFSALISLFISHRIAGPLVRLKEYFQSITDKKKIPDSALAFRKNDYMRDLAPTIQAALKTLKSHEK